mmetsp:Transcript_12196/g.28623  ORF Transcript_12196/g.28623 Transcript_12196/m.28623 type:complete len:200 (+) Transcript_12196:106-705(+)
MPRTWWIRRSWKNSTICWHPTCTATTMPTAATEEELSTGNSSRPIWCVAAWRMPGPFSATIPLFGASWNWRSRETHSTNTRLPRWRRTGTDSWRSRIFCCRLPCRVVEATSSTRDLVPTTKPEGTKRASIPKKSRSMGFRPPRIVYGRPAVGAGAAAKAERETTPSGSNPTPPTRCTSTGSRPSRAILPCSACGGACPS